LDVANGTDLRARLFQVLRALVASSDLTSVAEGGLDAVLEALHATTGAVYLIETEGGVLRRIAARNLAHGSPLEVVVGEGLVGECAASNRRRNLTLPDDPAFVTRTFVGDVAPRALVVCPLARQGGAVAGVLAVASTGELGAEAMEALDLIAPHFANALLEALALRERDRAASYFGRILSDVDAAVIATDRDGQITIWNPACERLWGIRAERALGTNVRDLGLARDLVPLRDAFQAVFVARRATTLDEVVVDPPEGGMRLVRLRVSPLTDDDGHLAGAIVIGVDVTEERMRIEELGRQKLAVESLNAALRRQARALAERQTELEQKNVLVAAANRSKSEFIANMSHELRTPLNSIRGFCRLLLDERREGPAHGLTEPERREFLEIVDRNGRELLALIDDILDLAKADAGRLSVDRERLDLGAVARDVASELAPLAQEKGIALAVHADERTPRVESDDAKLRRIVRNLLVNAIKFTHEGGVGIEVRPDGEGAILEVVDSGIGIAARDHQRIFEPFEQVDGSNARRYGGTGLGLSIVQRLASVIGATISLRSAPGKGSTFTLRVPLRAPEPPATEPARELRPPAEVPSRGRPVVVVGERDQHAFEELSHALSDAGLVAVWAPDGRDAVARAREVARGEDLAAVVLDTALPALDGYEALETLKADALTACVPIFLVADERAPSVVLGAAAVVRRPVAASELAAMVVRAGALVAGSVRRERRPEAPASPEAAEPKEPAARPLRGLAQDERGLAGKRILVVEDNEDSARLAKLLLEQRGCSVTLAPDAGQALAELRRAEPDAVIMDLMLPGLDGYEATRAIRQMPERARVPVVAATAAVLPGDKARALEAGCDDIVAKPYDVEELAARVAAAIQAREAASLEDRATAETTARGTGS